MSDYLVQLGVKVNTKDIDTTISKYQGKPIEIKSKLDTSGIDKQIANYKAKKPIEVDVKLNTTGIAKKIGEYKVKTPVKLNAKLDTKNIDAAISNYKSKKSIEVNVKLNSSAIGEQLRNYKAKNSIEVNAKLKKDAIDSQIRNYQTKTAIKVNLDLNYGDIDKKIREYEVRSPLRVKVKINKTDINQQLKEYGEADQYITVKAKLDNGAISQAIKDYKAKTPIKVDLILDHTDIDNKVSTYAKTPVQLAAKFKLINDINAQVKKYNISVPINLTVKQFDTSDIEEKIKGYTAKSSIKVGVKLDGAGINNQIKGYKINTPLKVVAELDTDSINSKIKGYKVKTPIKVALDLDTSKINEKIKNYKIGDPIEVNVRLDNKSVAEQIKGYLAKTSIGLNVELNTGSIEEKIRAYKSSVPIKVGVKLDTAYINNQIKSFKIQTPIQADIKLDTKDIIEQIRNYKTKSSIKVGVKLDSQKINEQIRNIKTRSLIKVGVKLDIQKINEQIRGFKTGTPIKLGVELDTRNLQSQINNIRQQIQSAGNTRINIGGNVGNASGRAAAGNENGGRSGARQVDEVTQAYRELMGVLNELNSKRLQLNNLGAPSPESSNKIQQLRLQIEQLDNEYNNLLRSFNAQGIQFTADQWNELETAMARVGRRIDVVQAGMADKSAIQSQTQAYKELLSISKEIGSLEINIAKLKNQGGNVNQIIELENRLRTLQSTYQHLVTTMNTPLTAEQWSSIYTQIAKTSEEINRLKAQHADMEAELAGSIKGNFSGYNAQVQSLVERFNRLSAEIPEVKSGIDNVKQALLDMKNASDNNALIEAEQRFQDELKETEALLRKNQSIEQQGDYLDNFAIKKEAALIRLNGLFEDGSMAAKRFGADANNLRVELDNVGNTAGVDKVIGKISNLEKKIKSSNLQTKTLGTSLKEQFSRYTNYLSVASVFMYAYQGLRSMFEQVKAIDSAMTELKKVTNETDTSYNKFLSNAATKSREIGTTIDGLVSSTADFARLGYGFEDAQGLAEVANIYAVVGDEVEGVEGATESLISTMAAFKDEANGLSNTDFAMSIIDKFNEIGNNFAISSGGIGEAMERSASSMMAANNTIDETIALITAANTVTQNPEVVGTAFKTMSMRIRGAKTELEEAGLETDGMVESTAKLREEIMALSGVDIMLNNNTFKSTYQILDELAVKWKDLTDIQQASITELIAGKRQGNVVSSLMTNFDTAREALETSLNSSGSAMIEHEKWQKSLEAQINKLKASWQGLSQAFLKSDFLHGALDAVIKLLDGLTWLIDKFGTLPTLLGSVAAGFSLFKNKGLFTFDKDANSIQLLGNGLTDLKSKYTQIQTAISRYNSISSKSFSFQEKYNKAMAGSSTSMGKYLSGLKGAKASFGGYIASLVGATIKTIALEAATMALNAALTMGISFAIQFIVEAFDKMIVTSDELAEKIDELVSKFQEEHNALKDMKGDFDTTNESSMISKYEKLSKGVDNLGRNVSLTSEEYSEYQSIVNKIAEQIPTLVSGYDEQGNALLNVKGNVEAVTEAYEKLIHIQNQEILTNTGDIEKDFANKVKDADGNDLWSKTREWFTNSKSASFWGTASPILGIFKNADMMQDFFAGNKMTTGTADALKELLNSDRDEIGKIVSTYDKQTLSEIKTALENANVDVGSWGSLESNVSKALEETLEKEPEKVKGIVDNFYGDLEEIIKNQKLAATSKLSEAFDVRSAISGLNYGSIGEDLQAVAYQVVNSLDYDFFTALLDSGKSIEQWTTEMLDQLNAIDKNSNTQIEAAFDLQTKFNGGEIPYGDYVNGLEDTGKLIGRLNLKDEVKTQLKLSLGLDEDGLVEEYKVLKNKLANNEKFDIMPSEYKHFLDGLSSEEVSVLIDIIPELEKTDYKETIADVKASLEKEMMLQGLTFDLNLEVEAAGLDALNTALSESVSATGLSSESIVALKGRYSDLEAQGYDLSSMFEETSTGIRLNRQEFDKLEKAYATEKLAKVDGDLIEMKSAYDDLGEAIKNCDDPIRKSELFNERQTLAKRISEAATLAHQYKGLTSAYNDWLAVEEAGQERDMYENVIKGFETVDDEISRGWIDDGTIEFLELLSGRTDLAGKSGKELKKVYDSLDKSIGKAGYSVRDFFTVNDDGESTNTGVYNFLETIESLGGKYKDAITRDDNNNIIGFNFELAGGDEAIAEALGVSEELVQIMVRAADDAGFVVSMDGTYRQLADLQNEAKTAANYLHEIGKTDFEFDFNTKSVENLKTQLEEARKILDSKEFWNEDGSFNFDADGATQAMQVVSTLQAKLDNLTAEKYGIGLTVEDEEFEEPLENLQDYGHKIATLNQLELNPKANAEEIEELNGELNEIAGYFANLDEDKKVELGFEADDGIEDVKKKIENGEIKIPTVLDIQANMDKNIETLTDLALLNSGLLSENQEETIRKKYKVEVEAEKVDTSDVEEKVENAVIDGLGNPILSRESNIKIVAETLGIDDVDDLSSKLEGLDDTTVQAIAEAVGQGNVEALDLAVEGMDGNTVDAVCNALGYDNLEELKAAIRNMKGNEVDAKVDTSGQAEKVWTLQDAIDSLKGKTVDIVVNTVKTVKTIVENAASAGKKALKNRFGIGEADGTANVDGTTGKVFKQGSWGTKNSGSALVGELGREILVRGGRYYTIGDNGAEFIKYQKGDIIFNHRQTEELFANGKVTSGGGRGKAFVDGTAFNGGSKGVLGGIVKVVSNAVGKVVEKVKEAIGKTTSKNTDKKENKKSNKTNKSDDNKASSYNSKKSSSGSGSNSSGSSGSKGGAGKVNGGSASYNYESSSSSSSSSSEKDFEDTIDWIEIAISRIEREIDNLDKKANNVYKTWSSRNKALTSEISKVGDEIKLQQSAYNRYMKEANGVGLSSSWAKKVREGKVDIQTIKDEALAEKIKDYQKWYELALNSKDAIEELRETESKLYAQRFENIQTQYDGILQGYEHTESMLNKYISQAEEQGYIVSKKYYSALIENEKQNINTLKQEQSALIAERDKAVADGKISKYSEEWYNMCQEIDGVTQAIEEGATALIEYDNAMRDIDWEKFDLIQERISDITAESEFLIELMSNKDLFDDNGKLTEQGAATMGLRALNYNTSMYQSDDYGKEIAKLDKQIAKDPYDKELINRRRELVELQRESILEAENQKNAIKDLVEEGINLELDALQERIDLHNEELDSMKDLYDYQKNVEEQTENIASLRKQLGAYDGFNDEETRAKVQELKVSLEEAEADLKETEYDKFISDQTALLDTLYTEYETILNSRLDNIDLLLTQVVDGINIAAGEGGTLTSALGHEGAIATAIVNAVGENGTIKGILNTELGAVGSTLSTAMNNIWSVGEGNAKSVLTTYGTNFQTQQTTTNQTLSGIKISVDKMANASDKEAQKKADANKTSTSAKKDPTKDAATKKPTTTTNNTNTNKSSGDGKAKVGDKVKFVSGKYYYDSEGKNPAGSQNQGEQVYITKINTASWATHPYHISTGKTLGSGDLGWLKLNQLSGYASGKKKISNSQYAWTQENGQEFIVRPSDGAILTPVAKNDSVLNATASGNIWSMANNPAEFIKDNLKLDTTNVPNGVNVQSNYTQHLDKVVFNLPNVKNYDELLSAMQKDKNFERLILSMSIDRIAGKSSLAKGKSIR